MINNNVKNKLREWALRYLPAELLSVIVTMIVAWVTFALTASNLSTAIVATWVGSGVYFGYILTMDIRFAYRRKQAQGLGYTLHTFTQNLKAMGVEFGVAELVDLLIIRPAMMYYFPIWFDSVVLGTFIAKISADLTFYVPAIIGYELSKQWLKRFD